MATQIENHIFHINTIIALMHVSNKVNKPIIIGAIKRGIARIHNKRPTQIIKSLAMKKPINWKCNTGMDEPNYI